MHVAIIGNGITGVTAALRVRANHPGWKITLVSGESSFHYSRPALMYIFMGHLSYQDTKPYEERFWAEQRLDLLRDWVTRIDIQKKQLVLHRGAPLAYDKLLLATGSKSNKFGWPGQDLDGVQGFYSLMDLRLLYENTRNAEHAVIVGGGLIGIELAEMLHSRDIEVTFLVREMSYWDNVLPAEESAMINRLIEEAGIGLHLSTQLTEIVDDGHGRCAAVITDGGDRLDCQLVGLTAGVSPNIDVVENSGIETGQGILVDESLRTSVPDVYAAGDCAEIVTGGNGRGLVQQVWYTGKMQGEVAGDVLSGEDRTYDPGIWYNSAKFLDLEYQTYGRVNRQVPGEKNLYWEHPDHRHAVRLVGTDDEGIIGLNFMGLRFSHRIAEGWIREHRPVGYVLDHLHEGNLDPEFSVRHEPSVVRALRGQL